MNTSKTLGLVILVIALILAYTGLFTVREGQKALLLRLGKIIDNPATGQAKTFAPGLHLKVPFLNQVRKFDVRLQTLTVESSRIMTEEQKYVLVDYYVKWKVADLPLYYQRTGGFAQRTEDLLEQQINDALRAAFGKLTITEVISGERANVMVLLQQRANKSAEVLGVKVIDVRIKSIDLPKEVSESVFARMSAEREQVATQHRSDGHASAEKIRATADAQAAITIAQAKAQAAKVRATGIAKAADIYAQAYGKDPKFYAFYRSMQAYQHAFASKRDILLLKPDSQFFRYFNSAKGMTDRKP